MENRQTLGWGSNWDPDFCWPMMQHVLPNCRLSSNLKPSWDDICSVDQWCKRQKPGQLEVGLGAATLHGFHRRPRGPLSRWHSSKDVLQDVTRQATRRQLNMFNPDVCTGGVTWFHDRAPQSRGRKLRLAVWKHLDVRTAVRTEECCPKCKGWSGKPVSEALVYGAHVSHVLPEQCLWCSAQAGSITWSAPSDFHPTAIIFSVPCLPKDAYSI